MKRDAIAILFIFELGLDIDIDLSREYKLEERFVKAGDVL